MPPAAPEPSIEAARKVALARLQPSQRDLEHGLELHRQTLVAESYGLFLAAPPDREVIAQALEAGAGGGEIREMMEEEAVLGWRRSAALLSRYRAAWEASGVDCTFVNAGEEGNQALVLLKRLARYVDLCDVMPEFHVKAVSVEAIRRSHREGKRALCLAPNGVPLAGRLASVGEELAPLKEFARLGARMMHLTYNRRNLIGDGCAESANGGLSDFGRTVIAEMNRLGIIVDLAHSGWQTSIEAARVSSVPVVISHAAVWNLSQHMRCKSDEVIRAVVESGGTIGITNIPRFLGGKGDLVAMLDHIDYVTRRFGVGAVTIGTDTGFQYPPEPSERWPEVPSESPRWENFWPKGQEVDQPEWNRPEQLQSLSWTNWPLFTVGLVQRGYSDEEIAAIIGGNLLRVAAAVWK